MVSAASPHTLGQCTPMQQTSCGQDACIHNALTYPQAVLAGERVTGEGFVGALDHDVGIPFWEAEPFIGFIVLFLLALGVYPSRTRLLHPRQRTRANIYAGFQRLVGRLACLTLAGTILLEVITGKVGRAAQFLLLLGLLWNRPR